MCVSSGCAVPANPSRARLHGSSLSQRPPGWPPGGTRLQGPEGRGSFFKSFQYSFPRQACFSAAPETPGHEALLVAVEDRRKRDLEIPVYIREDKRYFRGLVEFPGDDVAGVPVEESHQIHPSPDDRIEHPDHSFLKICGCFLEEVPDLCQQRRKISPRSHQHIASGALCPWREIFQLPCQLQGDAIKRRRHMKCGLIPSRASGPGTDCQNISSFMLSITSATQ